MKTKLLLFLLLSNFCFSQIKFESGYYKDNAGTVVKCLIKNEDWLKNPAFIEIKLAENDAVVKKTIAEISEFGIDNTSKYIKATVDIDDFVDDFKSFSNIADVTVSKKTVLLKVENEGKANLYSYLNENLKKYFFSKPNDPIKLLVFKKYLNDENQILQNNAFRQTLLDNLDLNEILLKKLSKTKYELDDLNEFFQIYNNNKNAYTELKNNPKRKTFNFNVKAGVVFNSYKSMVNENLFNYFSFPAQTNFGFGLEIEHVLKFNNNKWSLYLDPTFESFSSNVRESQLKYADISLKIINVGFGIRHNMFLTDNSNLFINVGLQLANIIGNKEFIVNNQPIKLESNNFGFAAGIGFKYQKKYAVEFRFRPSQDLTYSYGNYASSYLSSTLFFGYTIF